MLYFEADPRDGGHSVDACGACCCKPLSIKPGETNLMSINYAHWALPIGWIVPGTQYSIVHDQSACPTGPIEGFEAPTVTNYSVVADQGQTLLIDLAENATPAANALTFELVPLSGPENGTITAFGADGLVEYSPRAGFSGYDYFSFKMTDGQGRSLIRTVQIATPTATGSIPGQPKRERMALMPFIDAGRISTDEHTQVVRFPISMPLSCRACDSYRLTIQQPARDCDGNHYVHLMCFDIRCRDC